jgi:hypothetical protein
MIQLSMELIAESNVISNEELCISLECLRIGSTENHIVFGEYFIKFDEIKPYFNDSGFNDSASNFSFCVDQ